MNKKTRELHRRQAEAYLAGGQNRIEQQHAKGKLTARDVFSYFLMIIV